jgi:hypothetical protein
MPGFGRGHRWEGDDLPRRRAEVKKWVVPVRRFPLRVLNIGPKPVRLRPDAADAWQQIVLSADKQGATLRNYNRLKWWHFQFKHDKQPTFLDEMELIGYTEGFLAKTGWPDEMLDHAPG